MPQKADSRLESEIRNLAQYIKRFRVEIARINKGDPDSNFRNMSDHLDAITQHTDSATHNILQNLEGIADLVGQLQDKSTDGDTNQICDAVMEKATNAMEECTFQDITGQRVTKIISSIRFVEERVNAMIELMGREMIEAEVESLVEPEPKDPDAELLNGPQLPGQAISQDDIDKLFA
jgi:chemotaxis protein CheZ